MKSILIFALLLALGTVFLTGCTTVPRDNNETNVRRNTTTTSSAYSK